MSVRRSLIILTLFTLAVPVAASTLRANQQAAEETARIEAVAAMQTYTVQRGTVFVTIPAVGTIEAEETAGLSFLTSGQIEQILVQEGDFVEAGTPLVQLKNRAEVIAFEQANLNYESAVRQYQDLLVVDEDEITIAEANLNSARGSYTSVANAVSPEDIAAAELQYQQALVALDGAQMARYEASPELSEEALALLDAKIGAASFDAETARLRLEDLRSSNSGELGAAGAKIAQAERELEQARAGASEYEIAQAQISIDQAAAQLDQAQLNYDRTILRAPFAGVISGLNIEAGQRVSAGVPLVELVDVSPLSIVGEIDEIDVRAVEEGLPAQVEMDALPNSLLDAEVMQLASAGQEQNGRVSYEIRLHLNSADARIRPGMTAEANIIVQQIAEVMTVPNRYIQLDRERGVFFVNVLMADDTLEARDVTVGTRGDDYTEILSGVQLGETLAFTPQNTTPESLFGG
jgi:HlyD family secretion protein